MKQRVVIIGHGYTSRLGVIRAIAEIGCDISVIVMTNKKFIGRGLDRRRPIDCYSKYVSKVYYCYKKDAQGLIQLLLDECVDYEKKAVIIPDSDFSASVIDKNQNRLNQFFLFPHINHSEGEVTKWMDKRIQKELAHSLGLNVPSSFVVNVINGQYELPTSIHYPCFAKPLITLYGDKYMKRCCNEEELRVVIEHLGNQRDNRVLVEDFMVIEDEYALNGFSDGTNVVIPGIIHFLRSSKSHFGLAMQGEIMPVDGFEVFIAKLKEFVRKIGYVGAFDIDFYRSDGTLYFGEINLRIGGSGYAVTKMGVNLPAMMVQHLAGLGICDREDTISRKAVFANERMCLDDWYQGYLSTKEYHQILNSSDICFVKDSEDCAPQLVLEKKLRRLFFKRCVRNSIRRVLFR